MYTELIKTMNKVYNTLLKQKETLVEQIKSEIILSNEFNKINDKISEIDTVLKEIEIKKNNLIKVKDEYLAAKAKYNNATDDDKKETAVMVKDKLRELDDLINEYFDDFDYNNDEEKEEVVEAKESKGKLKSALKGITLVALTTGIILAACKSCEKTKDKDVLPAKPEEETTTTITNNSKEEANYEVQLTVQQRAQKFIDSFAGQNDFTLKEVIDVINFLDGNPTVNSYNDTELVVLVNKVISNGFTKSTGNAENVVTGVETKKGSTISVEWYNLLKQNTPEYAIEKELDDLRNNILLNQENKEEAVKYGKEYISKAMQMVYGFQKENDTVGGVKTPSIKNLSANGQYVIVSNILETNYILASLLGEGYDFYYNPINDVEMEHHTLDKFTETLNQSDCIVDGDTSVSLQNSAFYGLYNAYNANEAKKVNTDKALTLSK